LSSLPFRHRSFDVHRSALSNDATTTNVGNADVPSGHQILISSDVPVRRLIRVSGVISLLSFVVSHTSLQKNLLDLLPLYSCVRLTLFDAEKVALR